MCDRGAYFCLHASPYCFFPFFLFLTIDELHLADLVWSTNHGAFRGLYRFLTVNSFDLERLVYGIVTSAKKWKSLLTQRFSCANVDALLSYIYSSNILFIATIAIAVTICHH